MDNISIAPICAQAQNSFYLHDFLTGWLPPLFNTRQGQDNFTQDQSSVAHEFVWRLDIVFDPSTSTYEEKRALG
jgi:hypothetical protein